MTSPDSSHRTDRSGWGTVMWAGTLSLAFPGLGHVYARAWRLGAGLLSVSIAVAVALRATTAALPPTPGVVTAWLALLAALVALMLGIAVDAARRARRRRARPASPWWRSTWVVAALVAVLQAGLAVALPFGWRSFTQASASMEPGQAVGDVFLADVRPDRPPPVRGDIVLFTRPGHPGAVYVKRVIGLPGDRVAVRDGVPALDDHPVAEEADGTLMVTDPGRGPVTARAYVERLPGGARYRIARFEDDSPWDVPPTTVPPGRLFVLGDNRGASLDSRHAEFGPVRAGDLVGVAGTFIWSRVPDRIFAGVR